MPIVVFQIAAKLESNACFKGRIDKTKGMSIRVDWNSVVKIMYHRYMASVWSDLKDMLVIKIETCKRVHSWILFM